MEGVKELDQTQTNIEEMPKTINLKKLVAAARNASTPHRQFSALQALRKILSKNEMLPISHQTENDMFDLLVNCVGQDDNTPVQFQAAWALSNFVSLIGDETNEVRAAAVPIFVKLLSSPVMGIKDRAIFGLSKISGYKPELRNLVIAEGAVQPLLSLIKPDIPILANATWLIANICCSDELLPPADTVAAILPALNMLIEQTNVDVLVNAVFAIYCLSDGDTDQIQMVIDSGIIPKLIPLLRHVKKNVQLLALRTVSQIMSGTDEQAQVLLDNDALSYFPALLSHSNNCIQRSAVRCLTKIFDGTQSQIQAVIDKGLLVDIIGIASNPSLKFDAVRALRNLVALSDNPPITYLLNNNVLPLLMDCIKDHDVPILQYEATWTLSNLAYSTSHDTEQIVGAGAVPLLIQLLQSPNLKICELAVWALANIIGDGPVMRDMVIEEGIVPPLVSLIKPDLPLSLLRGVAWLILNMRRSQDPPPPGNSINALLPAMKMLLEQTDTKTVVDAVWAISGMADDTIDQIELLIEMDLVHKLVPLLGHDKVQLQKPALRAVGNIAGGSDDQAQVLLDCDVLSYLPDLMTHSEEDVRIEAVWCLSNIIGGNQFQVQEVIDEGLLPLLIDNLEEDSLQMKTEAAHAVNNLTITGNRQQVFTLIRMGVLPSFCDMLECELTEVVDLVLNGLYYMLKKAGPNVQQVADLIEEWDGLEKILELRNKNNSIANNIITEFFPNEL